MDVLTRTPEQGRLDTLPRRRLQRTKAMRVAVTFDDGPSEWTGPILDLLAEHNAKATFFVCGANIPGRVYLIDRIHTEGHTVGNHTTNHPNLSGCDWETVKRELLETSLMVGAVTGQVPKLWRAPYLRMPERAPTSLRHVGCDVIPGDWKNPDAAAIARTVLDRSLNDSVVLFHDGRPPGQPAHAAGGSLDSRQQTVDALAILLPELAARGYRTVGAEDL